MAVRASPLSKTAALLIIAVGVFVLVAGLTNDDLSSEVSGAAFIALGLVLYRLLFRFARRLGREIEEAEKAQA